MSRKLKDLDSKWGGVRAAAEDDGTETAAVSSTGNSAGSVTLEILDSKWGKPTGREGMSQYETKRTANLNTYVSPERAAAIQKIRDNAAQNKSLLRQTEGQDKAARYAAVNRYFEGDADARRLWKLERGYNANPNAAAARKAEAEALRRGMQPEQREAYNEATKLYDSYGRAYSAGRRAKDVIGGSLKSAADSIGTFMEGMALGGSEESKRAQWEMRQAMDNGTAFTRDENGDLKVSDSYKKALDTYNKTKNDKVVLDEDFSPALARNRADQAQVERGLAGTSGVTRKAGELAGSMAQNAPGMASALIPGVGFGVSMGALGLQAAGSRLDELSARGIDVREALARGAVSGAIEVGTEMVPIGEWVPEKIGKWVKQPVKNWVKIVKEGGESAAENLAKQAMGEATEEGASYVLNYLADLAAKDPEAEFSLAELADNMAMGAASGAAYGVIGTGINRALGGSAQVNENPPYRAGKNAAEGGVVNQSTIQDENGAQKSAQAGSAAQETAKNLSGLQEQAAQLARQALAEQEARRQEQAFTQPLIQQVQQETAQMADRNGAVVPSPTGEGTGVLEMIAAQRSMVQNGMTADEAQAAYAARQQRSAGTARVQALADSGIYNEPMREALVKNYQGGSLDTYVQAMNGLYNAGRTGSLSFEQGVRAVAPAAAVVDNESALRAAYDAGRSTVTSGEAMPTPGITNERQSVELRGVRKEDSSAPLEALQLAAMKLGTDFTIADAVQDESGNSANGMYDPASNRITLSEKSANPYQTALHETAHYIEQYNAEGWAQLKQALLAFYTERVGMTEAQEKVFKAYENAYGTQTDMFDEVAADLLSGIMSTDEGVERYCDYILTADQYTTAEKKTVLETLRQIIDQLISSIKRVLTGGDATLGAAEGRRLAEQAENLTEAASIIDDALDELDIARKNARETGAKNVQIEQKEGKPKKYSYVGVQAESVDREALHEARVMEKNGEDAESIRKKTGWFRGADRMWRYEIDNRADEWNRKGDNRRMGNPDYADLKALWGKMNDGTINEAEWKRLGELTQIVKLKNASEGGTLEDYLKAPGLYEQYPALKDVNLKFETMPDGTKGYCDHANNTIVLSKSMLDESAQGRAKSTLLHEVQHWIQHYEGFATGSNPGYWQDMLAGGNEIVTREMQDQTKELQRMRTRYSGIDRFARYAEKYVAEGNDAAYEEVYEKAAQAGINEDVLDLYRGIRSFVMNPVRDGRTPFELYRDTAGEIEARDVQQRMDYTNAQRRDTRPNTGDDRTVFANDGSSFSIDRDAEGHEFVNIDEDILNGVADGDIKAVIRSEINRRFPDGFMRRGWKIEQTRIGRKEFTNSNYTRMIERTAPQVYQDKMRMAANLDEIIAVANEVASEPAGHARKDGVVSFNRSKVMLRVGGNNYTADVVTAVKPGTHEIFYDIVNVKPGENKESATGERYLEHSSVPTDTDMALSVKGDTAEGRNLPTENVPQNGKKVKFSMNVPVEQTKDLVAVHNVDEDALARSLRLGGLPMPSIAIIKSEQGHTKYGPISLVFGKESIDPQLRRENKVYGGDGWTPTKAAVEYKVNYDAAKRFEKGLNALAGKICNGIFSAGSVLEKRGISETTDMNAAEIAKRIAEDDGVRAAYLADTGKTLAPVMQEKVYNRRYGNDVLKQFTDQVGEKRVQEIYEAVQNGASVGAALGEDADVIRGIIHDYYKKSQQGLLERHAKKMGWSDAEMQAKGEERIARTMQNIVTPFVLQDFAMDAWKQMTDTNTTGTEIDRTATSDKLREAVRDSNVAAWVKERLTGVLGEEGIYNGKERYTASGNVRSFAQLHYPVTLENIVKAMSETQQERGEGAMANATGLQAVSVRQYKNLAEIKQDSSRLARVGAEEYDAKIKALDSEIDGCVKQIRRETKTHTSNTYEEETIIGDVILQAAGKGTAAGIRREFAKEGYDISNDTAKKLLMLYSDAAELPTEYFEAKPRRAVGFDEVRAAIVPDTTGEGVRSQLEKLGVPVIEYTAGDEAARLKALNSVENVRFSKKQGAAEQIVGQATEKEQLKKQLTESEAEKRELARKYARAAESAEYWRQ